MPSRIIRESCRTSPTLAQLSHGAERLFWRLTTLADDYGRFESDPRILKGACFSIVDSVTTRHCQRWLDEMVQVGLVLKYNVNGKEYGHFPTWPRHQRKRPSKSKYPDPPQLAASSGESPQHAAVVMGYGAEGMEPREERETTTQGTLPRGVLGDAQFLEHLRKNPAYQQINFDQELAKLDAWLLTPRGRGKKKTRGRILAWMNRALEEQPVKSGGFRGISL